MTMQRPQGGVGVIARLLAVMALWLSPWALLSAQPKLAVVIVVDQMRADFLDEFAHDYSGGLARLREQGAVFVQARHDHALTETSPGYATIATGVFPSRHGLVGNEIWDRPSGQIVGAVIDPDGRMVGAERRSGRSPHRLLREGFSDWLKTQSPDSKSFAIAVKDRSAIALAGMHPDGAYWYDERAGRFATSSYYREELPPWVVAFNAAARVDAYYGTRWEPLYPAQHYGRADTASSLVTAGRVYSEFPHELVGESDVPDRRFYTIFRLTPFADRLALEFARQLIDAEQLGTDASSDLALIGLSAADYIGHRYGPWSAEVHDYYAHIDAYLGEFLAYLDQGVGAGEYIVVLTADHGVMPIPEQLAEQGTAAVRLHPDALLAYVEPAVAEAVRRGVVDSKPVLRYEFGVIFDFGDARVTDAQRESLQRIVAARLAQHPVVAEAFTYAQLRAGDGGESPWFGRFQRSFHPERAPDVVVLPKANQLITDRRRGTTHGSPYDYDSHVPLVFWGPGIERGRYEMPVRTVDIAPTLAGLLGIAAPEDLDGVDLGARLHGEN